MKVPFVNLQRDERETLIDEESVESRIIGNVLDVIKRKNFILGDYVERFEREFAAYCWARYCVGVGSGLSALEMALLGCGVKEGSEVIVPANTFNATVAAIAKVGAQPVLVDVDENNFNIQGQRILDNVNERTRAIMPVHLYGQIADISDIKGNLDSRGIKVVEDACQAHGARLNGKAAGAFGEAGGFSFYPGKNLGAWGDGGAIVTDNKKIFEFASQSRNYGQTTKYHHGIRPDNSRLDTIQAVVLLEKLKVLDQWNSMRIRNVGLYREALSNVEEVVLPLQVKERTHVHHLFVIKAERRDELKEHLETRDIQTGLHYPVPIHLQKCFGYLGYKEGDFPVSERLSREILSLPMFPTLKKEEIGYVCDSIKEFYSKKAS